MIRVLLMIAVAGFVLSVASIAAAVAMGGSDFVARGGWMVAGSDHGRWKHWDHDDDRDGSKRDDRWGADASRTVPWSGADSLDLELAADVRYIQADGPPTVTISGPEKLIDHVVVVGDTIKYEDRGHRTHRTRLSLVVRAPNIWTFDISGNNDLTIENYRQPRLRLDASGSSEIRATGETDEVALDLSGSGDVNLKDLKTKGARIEISGSADATIAPTEWADVEVSGRGDVRLMTRPPKLVTDISGSGRIRQGEEDASPSPSPSPSTTPSPPSPKGAKT